MDFSDVYISKHFFGLAGRGIKSQLSMSCALTLFSEVLVTMDLSVYGESHTDTPSRLRVFSIADPTYSVKVTGLADTVDECILSDHFGAHGIMLTASPIIYRFDERYALVKFTSVKDAENSVILVDNTSLHGKRIHTVLREEPCSKLDTSVESKEPAPNEQLSSSSDFRKTIQNEKMACDSNLTHSDVQASPAGIQCLSSHLLGLSDDSLSQSSLESPRAEQTFPADQFSEESKKSTVKSQLTDHAERLDSIRTYKVKVSRLSKGVKKNMLHDLFKSYGKLVGRPEIIRTNKISYAWMKFSERQEAENAVRSLNNKLLEGEVIRVKIARSTQELIDASENFSPPERAGPPGQVRTCTSDHLFSSKKTAASEHLSQVKRAATPEHPIQPQKIKHLSPLKKTPPKHFSGSTKKASFSKSLSLTTKTASSEHLPPSTKNTGSSKHLTTHTKKTAHCEHLPKKTSPSATEKAGSLKKSKASQLKKASSSSKYRSQSTRKEENVEATQSKPKTIHPDEMVVSLVDTALKDCDLRYEYEQSQLQVEIQKNRPYNVTIFKKLLTEKEINTKKLHELKDRKKEFTAHCENLRTQLLTRATPCNEKEIRIHLNREISRFTTGLPIYSHRQEIIDMIRNNQVSILTAETGSGKSTQLVQYLHESGFAKSGVIVCTQPRKVAAMSLAEYVSSELQQKLGTLVGYKTGVYSRLCKQTKILYVTDHALLNECVRDPSLSKYSCIIVDEAHERSLHTDVLLAFIKQILTVCLNLRVVITSATIDPEIFKQYFGAQCPVMAIKGRLFPVEVFYDVTASNPTSTVNQPPNYKKLPDYVKKAVDFVKELHVTEPKGDILVFLTSPGEVEQACYVLEEYTRAQRSAIVLALHGKLQPEDQQKVFKTYPKRKIVFSTNVAETSVTIPGIKYIVDSGLAKELSFDSKKNMNSLEVRMISKSSADQRKGRAGRTSEGKCYRLYSEDTYNDMPQRTLPEILRTTLSGTVLKLHELGVKDVHKFDFIEAPDHAALDMAIKVLNFLGAVDGGCLTNIGKKMSLLPIDPRLSKIVLDSFTEKLISEAVASVSISSLASTIFFRGSTDEMKEQNDVQKSTFCQPEGDQITYLVTYNEWLSQKQSHRIAWCQAKSVNAKSMKIVRETIKELQLILKQHLHYSCHTESLDIERASEKLPYLYFKAFANNICAFLGHEKIGYYNPSLPEEALVVFPGSSLSFLNLNPPLLAFEKTLKTSQHFLLQVFPVKEEWVQEAVQSSLLKCHPTSCEGFKNMVVTPFTVYGLGMYTLERVIREQKQIVTKITGINLKEVQFTASPEEGSLKVFVQPRFHEHMHQLIKEHVCHLRDNLTLFVFETGVTADDDNVRVLIGSGGSISNLMMPNQFRTVVVRGVVDRVQSDSMVSLLSTCGPIEKHNFSSDKVLYVTFSDPKNAAAAIDMVEEDVEITPKMFKKQEGLAVCTLSLKIEWYRRNRKNFVNIKFHSSTSTLSCVCDQLSSLPNTTPGFYPDFAVSKYQPQNEIFVKRVSPGLPEDQVLEALAQYLSSVGYSEDTYKVIFCSTEKFETSLEEFEELEEELHALVSQHATNFNIRFEIPQAYHRKYMAFVNFSELTEGLDAMAALKDSEIRSKPLTVTPCLTSVLKYSMTMHLAVADSIKETTTSIHTQYKSVTITEKPENDVVVVKVRSNDLSEYIGTLNMLNRVLQPLAIPCVSQTRGEYLRSKQCEDDLARIGQQSTTVICKDSRKKCLKVYGTNVSKEVAKEEFANSLSSYDNSDYYELELKSKHRPPGLLKHLITTYGIELNLLLEVKGIVMARIDIRRHILVVCATTVGYRTLLKIIDQFVEKNKCETQEHVHSTKRTIECCICYAQIEDIEDMYTLEYCGHSCHYECVEAQLAPHAITVPVLCASEECSKPFVWQDFINLQSKGKIHLRDVITQSVQRYIETNTDVVHHCPTPDCKMVYTVTSERGCFLCSHCGVLTCTKCHSPFHCGITCAVNLQVQDSDEHMHVLDWLKKDPKNRKQCPKCGILIEKAGGCQHMTCKGCDSHICWHCLEYFETGSECGDHLSKHHGGYF